LKPERWGSPLVQEKYREKKACDKRHPYRKMMMMMMMMIKIRHYNKIPCGKNITNRNRQQMQTMQRI